MHMIKYTIIPILRKAVLNALPFPRGHCPGWKVICRRYTMIRVMAAIRQASIKNRYASIRMEEPAVTSHPISTPRICSICRIIHGPLVSPWAPFDSSTVITPPNRLNSIWNPMVYPTFPVFAYT